MMPKETNILTINPCRMHLWELRIEVLQITKLQTGLVIKIRWHTKVHMNYLRPKAQERQFVNTMLPARWKTSLVFKLQPRTTPKRNSNWKEWQKPLNLRFMTWITSQCWPVVKGQV